MRQPPPPLGPVAERVEVVPQVPLGDQQRAPAPRGQHSKLRQQREARPQQPPAVHQGVQGDRRGDEALLRLVLRNVEDADQQGPPVN
eukprot:560276-Lingulodinium_polyedra.AAC.1